MKTMLELHAACTPVYAAILADERASAERYRDDEIAYYEERRRYCGSPYQLTAAFLDSRIAEIRSQDLGPKTVRVSLVRLGQTDEGAAILAAIDAAQWGAQPDGTFITSQHNAHWIANSGDCCTVHAPAKQGELVVASVHHDQPRFVSFAARADARAKRDAEKAAAKAAHKQYEADLGFAADALWVTGLTWHASGVFGGTVLVHGRAVSARGALARAWGVRCTCGRRAGGHADRLPMVDCVACDRAEEFGAVADEFRAIARSGTIALYADGAYCEIDGTVLVWGPTAHARAGRSDGPIASRVRDSRTGKFVWCDSRQAGERRTSKRIARRAERRFLRAELAQAMTA